MIESWVDTGLIAEPRFGNHNKKEALCKIALTKDFSDSNSLLLELFCSSYDSTCLNFI